MPLHPFVQRAQRIYAHKAIKPIWYDTVVTKYPPIQLKPLNKKPVKIVYPEDKIRRKFYAEHPMELKNPISIDEATDTNLAGIDQFVKWNMVEIDKGMDVNQAYKLACAKFYEEKRKEEIENRVAIEQALAFETISGTIVLDEFLKEEKEVLQKEAEKQAKIPQKVNK